MNLDELAIKHRTDKSSKVHNYTEHYQQYFEPIRNEPLKILEIGVQSGASLRMWKEYFPNAEIFGYDYYDCQPYEEHRIKLIRGAQDDVVALEELQKHGVFDIIIDDGSHKNMDILICFEYLFPKIAPGGIYIIEDLSVCYWGDTHNVGKPYAIERMKGLVDDVFGRGKSGIGDPRKDQKDGEFKNRGPMTWYEKNVKFVHFYRSMAFIGRQELLY